MVRDKIIGLEDKSDAVIAVNVPITVAVIPGRAPLYDKIARCIMIKPADNVKQGCFAAPGRPENTHKFIVTKFEIYAFQRMDIPGSDLIDLPDLVKFQHMTSLRPRNTG